MGVWEVIPMLPNVMEGQQMYGTKLCMSVSESYGLPAKKQISMLKEVGFEGFFTTWEKGDDIRAYREEADRCGMFYQSLHAPFANSANMWKPYEEAKPAVEELLECLSVCKENDIPIMVCHAYIGFDNSLPTEQGVQNFKIVTDAAKELGVRIAFENTEGEAYLDKLMEAFLENENVGFCWDTGHELCYNRGKDMLEKYGKRLFCTHLNDNLGIRNYAGEITWLDDLHILPFDGIANWKNIVKRLNKYDYKDVLTFELNINSKPGRHENDAYAKMDLRCYFTECYKRACRVAALKNSY